MIKGNLVCDEKINTMLSRVYICVRSPQCCCDDDGAFYLEMFEFMGNIIIKDLSCLFERYVSSVCEKSGGHRNSEQSD